MLDVGFGELFCFGIIALSVLGPDKLPVAARFVAAGMPEPNVTFPIYKTRLIVSSSCLNLEKKCKMS